MTRKSPNRNTKGNAPGNGGKKTVLAIVLFIMGVAVLAGYYLEKTTIIKKVDFSGHHFTDPEQMHASISSPVGQHADSIDYGNIMNDVNKLPYVKNSSVSKGALGNLVISVKEREPIGLITGNNEQVYFDEEGVQLPLVLEKPVDVPLVYGFRIASHSDTLSGKEFEQVKNFLGELKNSELAWITISEVAWNNEDGIVALTFENGVKLLFGKDNFDRKIKHWEAFYSEIVKTKGIESFRNIDLRFYNQIVANEINR